MCPDPCRDKGLEELRLYYLRLVARSLGSECRFYGASRLRGGSDEEVRRALLDEQLRIEKMIPASAKVVLLSEKGRCHDTAGLCQAFERWLLSSRGGLFFVLGGPHGLSQGLYTGKREILSLSPMTLPHELALVVFLEQLYRITTIRDGKRYHY